jgi:hypothetical protein
VTDAEMDEWRQTLPEEYLAKIDRCAGLSDAAEDLRALVAEVRRLRALAADTLTAEAQRLGMYDRPALTWSPEPPKEAGWYWRSCHGQTPEVVCVVEPSGGLGPGKGLICSFRGTPYSVDGPWMRDMAQWAGPIQPPPLPAEPARGRDE